MVAAIMVHLFTVRPPLVFLVLPVANDSNGWAMLHYSWVD